MRARWTMKLALLTATFPGRSLAQEPDTSALPVVAIEGPTVVLFWTSPDSISDPDALGDLYAALDQQQTTMADTREALSALGMTDVSQPGRRFLIRDEAGERVFTASPDSSVVGYLLVAPEREDRVLYRVRFADVLVGAAREFLGMNAGGGVR